MLGQHCKLDFVRVFVQRRRSNSFTDSYSPRDPAEDDSGSPVVVRPLTTVAARAWGLRV